MAARTASDATRRARARAKAPVAPGLAVEWWPLSRVLPYDQNPRKISALAVDKVLASIRRFGWRQPIVVDRHGVIIIGHVRRLAAIKGKIDPVPVHVADLTPEEARALRLADNRTNEESLWDNVLLASELGGLEAAGMDLALTGFNGSELDHLLRSGIDPAADAVIEPPAVPVSRPGDLWLLGPHRVYCGDAAKGNDAARLLGGRRPLLMVTDPPYGIELDSKWRDRAGFNGKGPAETSYMKKRTPGHGETSISGDTVGDTVADWSEAFALVPWLQAAYVWHASKFTREVLAGLERIGFMVFQQIIWNKGLASMTRTQYWFQHEPCWYVRKKNAPWFGRPGENTTIWEAASPKMIMGGSKEEKFDHPTQKPVALMQRPILNHTRTGELVYDPFLGSGTTLAAAEITGRVCCGMEIDPKYVDVTILRWQQLSGGVACTEDGELFESVAKSRCQDVKDMATPEKHARPQAQAHRTQAV